MSKTKKTLLVLVATTGLLAITALSTVFFVVSQTKAHASGGSATVKLAFTGLVTTGQQQGTTIAGGLAEVVQSNGYFNGNLHLHSGQQISTSGQIEDKHITITFYNVMGAPVIKGQGDLTSAGDFVGHFQILYQNKKVDNGIWSALPITNPNNYSYAFTAEVLKGPDTGTWYYGDIVLDRKTLIGTFNMPNGTVIEATGHFAPNGNLHVTLDVSQTEKVAGEGSPTGDKNESYKGSFHGPSDDDLGSWIAVNFTY
jgi:hypothetical protein